MMSLAGYSLSRELFSDEKISVFRAETIRGKRPVILKILKKDFPDPKDIAYLRHELSLLKNPKLPGVIHAYTLEKQGARYALVMEDVPDGLTLKEYLQQHFLTIDHFFVLAISLAGAVQKIHSAHIIHKDINPSHIIIDKNGQEAKLTDFSIATQLSRETPEIKSPEVLEGTLAYMSPEQSGRMNRVVDKRSDLYSLGITFYEMLTGHLPFEAHDPIEWVHCHIAKPPTPIQSYRNSVPKQIENIIMKLLSKAVEERYNSAAGLKYDLVCALTDWQHRHEIEIFPLGKKDRTKQFKISEKLYGREESLSQLLGVFERIQSSGRALVLVSGYPGIGKSSLVNEIHKPIVRQHGYFTSGKFDALQQKPYSALIQAFRQLMQQILTEGPKKIEVWRSELLKALSPSAQVIIQVIPEVEWLIGKQPPVTELPPTEAKNRFELVFFDFVHTFAKKEHPLVIFIDDLQWGDLASYSLIKQLLKDESLEHFILIGAYRDNEVDLNHPLSTMLEALKHFHLPIEHLVLKPLSFDSIKQLLTDTLGNREIDSLAKIVEEKTGGNPFFINAFLTRLYQEKYLRYNAANSEWFWSINELSTLTISDNVVDLVIHNIARLPVATQHILKIAASIGGQFDLTTLSIICKQEVSILASDLLIAQEENLIIALDNNYKLAIVDTNYCGDGKKEIAYKFSHDRVHQAAYSMINEDEKKQVDLRIGRLLMQKEEDKEGKLFEIVGHFNNCLALITKRSEKIKIGELNIRAGQKAKLSVAYASAGEYFKNAIICFGENQWEENYNMALEAHVGFAESLHLIGKFEEANKEFKNIVDHANNSLDKAKVTMLQVLSYTIQIKYQEALQVAKRGMSYLGVNFLTKPSGFRVLYELLKVKFLLRGKSSKSILALPKITDEEKKLIVDYYERMAVPAYLETPNLIAILCLEGIQFCLKHGYVAATSPMFLSYSMMLISVFLDYKQSYKYGKIALQIAEQFDDLRMKTLSHFVLFGIIAPWRIPYRECFSKIIKTFALGRQSGEIIQTNYAAAVYAQMLFVQGEYLDELSRKIQQMFLIADFVANIDTLVGLRILSRMTSVLCGEKRVDYFKEKLEDFIDQKIPASNEMARATSGILCLMGAFFTNEMDLGLKVQKQTAILAEKIYYRVVFLVAEYYFYSSLLFLLEIKKASLSNRISLKIKIKKFKEKLFLFSKQCRKNFFSKYALVEAALLHVSGDIEQAFFWYDKAIMHAKKEKFSHIEAVIYEMISRIQFQNKQLWHARLYLQEAIRAYEKWGAGYKSMALQLEYEKMSGAPIFSHKELEKFYLGTKTKQIQALDLSSVMKSSQLLSSKILLEDLVHSLVQIAVENAGATRGFLLLEKNKDLFVAAYWDLNEKKETPKDEMLDQETGLSLSVVRYVQNTEEAIVLQNATEEGNFTEDPYIVENKPLSILCGPIIHKGRLLGVFYLENNYTTGAFTGDRLEVLKLLSSQAAISLENAQLYSAYDRFVPHEFLDILGKHSIVDIRLGDHVQRNMSVLFADIRGFTSLSEKMTPAENFQFINDYLGFMEPLVQAHGGFIDKFIGDSIMALFPGAAQDAITAGIEMLEKLEDFNRLLKKKKMNPIQIGIGINTGNLMLGTLGGSRRIETSVISDAVNLASRIQELTKKYGTPLLIGEESYAEIREAGAFKSRFVGNLPIRGKEKEVGIWEIFSADRKEAQFAKMAVASHYEQAINLFKEKKYKEAQQIFERCLEKLPEDKVIQLYIQQCQVAETV